MHGGGLPPRAASCCFAGPASQPGPFSTATVSPELRNWGEGNAERLAGGLPGSEGTEPTSRCWGPSRRGGGSPRRGAEAQGPAGVGVGLWGVSRERRSAPAVGGGRAPVQFFRGSRCIGVVSAATSWVAGGSRLVPGRRACSLGGMLLLEWWRHTGPACPRGPERQVQVGDTEARTQGP